MELFLLLGVIVAKLIGENGFVLITALLLLILSARIRLRREGDFWYQEEKHEIKTFKLCVRIFLFGLFLSQLIGLFVGGNRVLGAGVYCGYVVDAKSFYSHVRVYHTATRSYVLTPINQKLEGNLSGLLYTSVEFSVSEGGKGLYLRKKDCASGVDFYYAFLRGGLSLKSRVNGIWVSALGSDTAVLLLSILVGNRSLPSEIKETVKSVGLLHVVAISGINIAYLQMLIGAVTKKLTRVYREVIDFACLLLLFLFVGEAISLLRAVITYCVAYFTLKFGLNKSGISVFSLTFVLLFLAIGDEWSGASALLTMGACFGIMIVASMVIKRVSKKVPSDLIVSLVVWLCVTPVQFSIFREISITGLFVGVLVSPLIELISMIGYIIFAVTLAVPELGRILVLIPGFLVSIFLFIVRLFHGIFSGG